MTPSPSPYFPADPHHPDLEQLIEQAVLRCNAERADSQVYALVHACLDAPWAQDLWSASQRMPHAIQPLYHGTPLAEAGAYSPFLFPLPRHELAPLLIQTGSLPVLSLVQSSLTLEQLRVHLARFIQIGTGDGAWFAALWCAPLCVQALIAAMDPPCKALLFSGFDAWHLINRTGTLDTVQGRGEPVLSGPVEGMTDDGFIVSEKALAELMDAFEADALLTTEARRTPGLVQGRRPSVLHDMARRVLREMDRLHLQEAPLRRRLLLKALECESAEAAFACLAAHVART